jgi:hypothetical protein
MALNFVTVTGTFLNGDGSPAAGSAQFMMSDLLWSTTGLFCGAVSPVGATFDSQGKISVPLLAMDNAGFSGNWSWLVTISVSGLAFPQRSIIVDFANGPTQDISALLNTGKLV